MQKKISKAIKDGDAKKSAEYANMALAQGYNADALLQQVIIPAIHDVSEYFVTEEFFITDVFLASRAASAALEVVCQSPEYHQSKKKKHLDQIVVIGTVYGDIHDLGKYIIISMLEIFGVTVQDLGVDVSCEKFVAAIKKYKPDIVMLSSLLTVTMNEMKKTIDAINTAGLNQDLIIMVGGAPITQRFAEEIGADAYADGADEMIEWLLHHMIYE